MDQYKQEFSKLFSVIEKLNEKIDDLQSQVDQLKNKQCKTENKVNNLISFMDSISIVIDDDYNDIIEDVLEQKSFVIYLERINFSIDYPQNYTVCIADKNRHPTGGWMYEDKWNNYDSRILVTKICETIFVNISKWSKKTQQNKTKYIEFSDYIDENGGKNKFIHEQERDIRSLLISNKDLVSYPGKRSIKT